jgi:Ca2+-binding RTX toxin-like protein
MTAQIETLESRRMLAASAALVGDAVRINGSGGADEIVVRVTRSNVQVTLNGKSSNFARSQVTRLLINGRGGNDSIRLRGGLPSSINGGRGNDNVTGGSGSDSILGGAGNDRLSGAAGTDLLNGEAGQDTISGGRGPDLSIDPQDRLRDPDRADQNLAALLIQFPGLQNDLFPEGPGGGGEPVFGGGGGGGGGPVFGGGGGSVFD